MSTMTTTPPRDIAIIGAGIVGISCALYIQRAGHRVTVIDRLAPGEGTSFGNAGCLNSSSVVPISMPGVLSQVPRWLLDPEGPLVLRWRYLPVLAPWLWRFVRAGTPERVAAQARSLRDLLGSTLESYAPLVKAAGAEDLVHRQGHLTVYKSEASFAKDGRAMGLRRDNGIVVEDLSFDELRQLEPSLSRDFVRGRMIAETGHVGDPHRLVTRLAEAFTRDGGRILREAVRDFDFADGAVTGVRGDSGVHRADKIILAAGAWSKHLAKQLGDSVPLDTERGYHVVLRDPEIMPRRPVSSADGKFFATPMEMGLRVAGTVEFAGLDAPPDWRRSRMLLRQAQDMFPALARDIGDERISQWMGFRPSMPDSLPVIGPSRRHRNVLHAFGHGHVGLIGGAMTGRIIAALVDGVAPPIDIAPFKVERFG
jgi:D-amino-acid dehydrogenase